MCVFWCYCDLFDCNIMYNSIVWRVLIEFSSAKFCATSYYMKKRCFFLSSILDKWINLKKQPYESKKKKNAKEKRGARRPSYRSFYYYRYRKKYNCCTTTRKKLWIFQMEQKRRKMRRGEKRREIKAKTISWKWKTAVSIFWFAYNEPLYMLALNWKIV